MLHQRPFYTPVMPIPSGSLKTGAGTACVSPVVFQINNEDTGAQKRLPKRTKA